MDKQKQLDIILRTNPHNDDLGTHTWIRTISDIKTYDEVWEEEGEIYGITPDFSKEDVMNALKTRKMMVYSSYPIENGIFVTPSRMEAANYSGNGKVYSKMVDLDDVAWIDTIQGQYAKVSENIMQYYGNCDTVRSMPKENGDFCVLYYNSDDAICFGFFPTSIRGNYKFKKKAYVIHYNLLNLKEIIGDNLCSSLGNNRCGEIKNILCYNKAYGLGRCWDDHKVIAFWKAPSLKTLKKVVRSLKIDPNEFIIIVGNVNKGEKNITVAQYMNNVPADAENETEIANKPLSSIGLGDIEDIILNRVKSNNIWLAQKEKEGWKTMAQRNSTLYQENKKSMKQIIRLTENELHSIIKESVNKILKENEWDTFLQQDDDEPTSFIYDDVPLNERIANEIIDDIRNGGYDIRGKSLYDFIEDLMINYACSANIAKLVADKLGIK